MSVPTKVAFLLLMLINLRQGPKPESFHGFPEVAGFLGILRTIAS